MSNLVLEHLNAFAQSMPDLSEISLHAGEKLPPSNFSSLVYFPVEGVVSIVTTNDGHSIDNAFVGREGFVGSQLAHLREGGNSTAVVRFGGRAIVASGNALRRALASSPAMRETMQKYGLLCLEQANQGIFAASRCTIEQRVASWLLMASNRLGSDHFNLTHATFAEALGVRRPSVTVGLHILEGKHAIWGRRGFVEIRSRAALIACAGSAYRDVFYDDAVITVPETPGPVVRRHLNEQLSAYL